MTIQIDTNYISAILSRMVQIDSRNPDLTPGSPGEEEIGREIAGMLSHLGIELEVQQLAENRLNVIGRIPGAGGGKTLALNGHMDTVGVEGMEEPYSGEARNGKLYGRGSFDMKGSLAAQLGAAKGLLDAGIQLAGDLILTFVADEEYASIGSEEIAKTIQADAVIVTEPTALRVCPAHRGFVWFEVTAIGKAAHGSQYQTGIDANMRMGRFLAELDKLEKALRKRPAHPLVGTPSVHAAMIDGGTALSVYANKCTLKVERRLNPGESVEGATAELQAIIDTLAEQDPTFQATLNPFFWRMPFETSPNAAIIQTVDGILTDKWGETPAHSGMQGWTDAGIFADAGMETMLIGPSGEGAHAAVEWVDLASVIDLAHILAETAVRYCGVKSGETGE